MSDVDQSPNIHFRELDDEFLGQQARIWLEAVVCQRFDQETSLADLLADGEILHHVSSIIRSLLQRHEDGEPSSPKSLFPEASYYEKHSGKYLPYSHVDAFLKVCQKLGLTGVDLFSPPDVVEKKDIRRVCLCIRTLSKKARAMQLGVPNFDYVTHTVPMPTEVVGGLRETLRQASISPAVPRGSEDKETPTLPKVRSSPSLFGSSGDAGVSVEASALASSDSSRETAKESGLLSSVTDNGSNGTGDNKIEKRQIPVSTFSDSKMSQPDTDFLRGSRSSSLFDDTPLSGNSSVETLQDVGHLPSLSDSLDPKMERVSETSSNEEFSGKSLEKKHHLLGPSDLYSEKSPAEEVADRGKEDSLECGKEKKKRVWLPIVAAVVALVGAVLVIRTREPLLYEVKKGDTLSQISKRTGKSNWEELVRLNPGIRNPDLIYPSERLRLRT